MQICWYIADSSYYVKLLFSRPQRVLKAKEKQDVEGEERKIVEATVRDRKEGSWAELLQYDET